MAKAEAPGAARRRRGDSDASARGSWTPRPRMAWACAARAAEVFAPGVLPPRPGVMAARDASTMSVSTSPLSSASRRLGLS